MRNRRAVIGAAALLALSVASAALPRVAAAGKKDRWTGVEYAIDVPESGTSTARVRKMWDQTRALIVKDAAANLSDDQYHAKRDPMFLPWTELAETVDRLRDAGTEKAEKVLPEILAVIDALYGFGGQPEPRIETRNTFKKAMDARLKKIDDAVKALP